MARLGEILLQRQLIGEGQLAQALLQQQRDGSRLGDILISGGAINYLSLYRTVAEQQGLPFIDLLKEPPDAALLRQEDAEIYLRLRLMPWRIQGGSVCVAACNMSDEVRAWAKARFGDNITFAITSPYDIRRTVESHFGRALEAESRLSLWHSLPHCSARCTILPRHKHIAYALLFLTIALCLWLPATMTLAAIIFCHAAYGATMLFKCLIFASGSHATRQKNWTKRLASLDERQLPIYTVLVPMYREAAILPALLENLRNLDYPVLCSSLPKPTR